MAQPAPIQFDLSTLRSDGTSQGNTNYTQVQRQDERFDRYLASLTTRFNENTQLVNIYGRHEFVGDLPSGFNLRTHTTHGGRDVDEVYGNPRGGYYRSAKEFTTHIGELLAANRARDTNVRTQVQNQNLARARQFAMQFNVNMLNNYDATGNWGFMLGYDDPNVVENARAFGFNPSDVDAAVLADRRNNPTIPAVPCNCTLR